MCDDFYCEPSEFEMQIEEFKSSLKSSVRQEILDELEMLRKENENLSDIKSRLKQMEQEHRSAIISLESAKSNAKYEARRERISSLLESIYPLMWKANSKSVQGEKCDKCNKNRKITYTTPLGREAEEDCACAKRETVYYPQEAKLVEFCPKRDDGNKISMWFKQYEEGSDSYTSSVYVDHVYEKGEDFSTLTKTYGLYFRDKEDCQSYCDWLNMNQK